MIISDLIRRIKHEPAELEQELYEKRATIMQARDDLNVQLANVGKVLRVVSDILARRRRDLKEVDVLEDALLAAAYASKDSDASPHGSGCDMNLDALYTHVNFDQSNPPENS